MHIRRVEAADIEQVAALEKACFPISQAATKESLKQRIAHFPNSFLVMENEGSIIAMINGCVSNQTTICDAMYADCSYHEEDGSYQAVFGLDVHPDYQHRGIAHQMMEALAETAIQAKRKGIILTCKEEKISFYTSMGFQNLGVSSSQHGGVIWYDMLRPL